MEGIQCPRSKNKKTFVLGKKIINETILNEYEVIRKSFNPNDKSPNLFNKRLAIRMQSYYNLLNSN